MNNINANSPITRSRPTPSTTLVICGVVPALASVVQEIDRNEGRMEVVLPDGLSAGQD